MSEGSRRIDAIDIVRGVAVVLMAIDHVRVYAGVPPGGPDPSVFFTRWVTHFVAPIFALLAGTAAYLYGRRIGDTRKLRNWLATRGLWLVLLELTVIRLAWTFNLDFATSMAGVLWMLGWCMVVLALLVRLPLRSIAIAGIVIVAGHNLINFVPGDSLEAWTGGRLAWLWQIIYFGGPIQFGEKGMLFVLYSIVPWIGVMAAGYAFGCVAEWEPSRRNRFCLRLGAAMTAAFIVLRVTGVYGDPAEPHLPAALAFLATTKYPASLQFLLMTLGPAIALVAVADRLPSLVRRMLGVFGSVPFFYYVLHIPLIHVLAIGVSFVRSGHVEPWLFMNHPALVPPPPAGYRWSLWLLYAITVVALGILYPLCRWYAGYKRTHSNRLLRYL